MLNINQKVKSGSVVLDLRSYPPFNCLTHEQLENNGGFIRDLHFRNQIESLLEHSCFPTCGLTAQLTAVALQDLEPGAKVTIDHATIKPTSEENFFCNCGYTGCRLLIGSFSMLPYHLQEKYLFHKVVPFLNENQWIGAAIGQSSRKNNSLNWYWNPG